MREKCSCGGEYEYVSPKHEYFAGTYLRCVACHDTPKHGKIFKKMDIPGIEKTYTKTEFGKKFGIKPPSVDNMVNSGRVKVVVFAGKEFIYYDGEE